METLAFVLVSVLSTIIGIVVGFVGAVYILYNYEKDNGVSVFRDVAEEE